jgi:hypothetical protein
MALEKLHPHLSHRVPSHNSHLSVAVTSGRLGKNLSMNLTYDMYPFLYVERVDFVWRSRLV